MRTEGDRGAVGDLWRRGRRWRGHAVAREQEQRRLHTEAARNDSHDGLEKRKEELGWRQWHIDCYDSNNTVVAQGGGREVVTSLEEKRR